MERDRWDRDAIDLLEPGFIEFAGDGTGQFGFIAVRGWMDCRSTERDGRTGVEFSWDGEDDGEQVSGRGWAAVVADALGDLPLALRQATTYLIETGMPIDDYLSLLDARAAELLAQGTPATYPISLAASYHLALTRLAKQAPAAVDLLILAAHLAPEPIPLTLFTTYAGQLPAPLNITAYDPVAFRT